MTMLGCDTGLERRGDNWFFTFFQEPQMDERGYATFVNREAPEHWDGNNQVYSEKVRAGCEVHLSENDTAATIEMLPEVIKNPRLAVQLEPMLQKKLITVAHVLVPVRDLGSVAVSKRQVGRNAPEEVWYHADTVAVRQESAMQLGELVTTLICRDIPHTFLSFPRFVTDPFYCYRLLCGFLPTRLRDAWPTFSKVFEELADKNYITHWPKV